MKTGVIQIMQRLSTPNYIYNILATLPSTNYAQIMHLPFILHTKGRSSLKAEMFQCPCVVMYVSRPERVREMSLPPVE